MLQRDGTLARGTLAVKDGRIVAGTSGRETLDVGERVILPGAIDPHAHFRDPGHPEKEDFGSGTRAAALGGVTTVLDMPNTVPPVFTREALDDKLARASAKAIVDFGLYIGLDAEGRSLDLLPRAVAMKIYLGATTGNLLVREETLVRRALLAAAAARRTVAVHCEHQGCLERHAHLATDEFPTHSTSRPAECESEAIRMLARAAEGTGARVHIAHLSTRLGVEELARTRFTAEACPHHLLLDAGRLHNGGRFKMNPPLRPSDDVRALFDAFASGAVPCLASDHAPHTPAEKDAARMRDCPAGVPGVQTMVPLLLQAAVDGRLRLARVVEASTAAARIFGLPAKGALAPGNDADIVVVDLAAPRAVRASDMASKAGWTPFEGMPALFPSDVFVRGVRVVQDGRVVGGRGRAVLPA